MSGRTAQLRLLGEEHRAGKFPRLPSVFRTGSSADVMAVLVPRYFPKATRVLDVCYGKGVFWDWPHGLTIKGLDLEPQVPEAIQGDGRRTGEPDKSWDLVVIDPPFMHGVRGQGSTRDTYVGSIPAMNRDYSHLPSQTAIIQLYRDLINEARRVCIMGVIVKCKDTVEHGDYVEASYFVRQALDFYSFRVLEKALLTPPNQLPTDKDDDVQHLRRMESYFYAAKPIRRPG